MNGDINFLYSKYLVSTGVSTDTRTIQPGMIFVGLRGERFNGSSLAATALEKGASWAIIDDGSYQSDRTTVVDNSLDTLQQLARIHRANRKKPVFALTGTNGKTTTKELIYSILAQSHSITATAGNYNNHIGVPLTILSGHVDDDMWIVEMGTNQPGDIAFLAEIAQPTHGLITNIGLAHLERLGSQLGIYEEKKALFDSVVSCGGTIFINENDQYLSQYKPTYKKSMYFSSDRCPWGKLAEADDGRYELSLLLPDEQLVLTNMVGVYNLGNCSAAMTVADHFGASKAQVLSGLANYKPSNMRSQLITTKYNKVILDAYNANPSSMRASIQGLLQAVSDNDEVVLILGDMLELGTDSLSYHRDLLKWIKEQKVSYVCIGRQFSSVETDHSITFDDVDDFIQVLEEQSFRQKTVLIKGSRGIKLEQIVPHL